MAASESDRSVKEWMIRARLGEPEIGPVSFDQIERGLAAGKIAPESEISYENTSNWASVQSVLASVRMDDLSADLGAGGAPPAPATKPKTRARRKQWPR
jgi:hypothetical protein